ncbi:hypothetical protein [Curtobacterium sp. CT11-133]|uniref:hypothetical protein n=1 Tax=Curtobacterium sp. CT11-133 TaxID=3243014 RepID=UPI0039AED003
MALAAVAVCGVATVTNRHAATAVAVSGTARADAKAEPIERSGSVIAWVTACPRAVGRIAGVSVRSVRRDGRG